jgi:hypothetical protein
MGCLIDLPLLRPMIDRSPRGRKKTVKKKKERENGTGLPYIFNLLG